MKRAAEPWDAYVIFCAALFALGYAAGGVADGLGLAAVGFAVGRHSVTGSSIAFPVVIGLFVLVGHNARWWQA